MYMVSVHMLHMTIQSSAYYSTVSAEYVQYLPVPGNIPVPGSCGTGTGTSTTQNHKMVLVPLEIPKLVLVPSRYRPKIWYRNTLQETLSQLGNLEQTE